MFNRLHSREVYDGSGLGLSIAQKIAAKLEGSIKIIESELDQGSWFQVKIPSSNFKN